MTAPSANTSASAADNLTHFSLPVGRELVNAERASVLAQPLQKGGSHHTSKLNQFTLSGKSLSSDAATVFAEALQSLPTETQLTHVDLSDIIAGRNNDEAVAVLGTLCNALARRNQLLQLNLSDNAIGAQGVHAIASALNSQTKLQRIYFNNNGMQGESVRVIVDNVLKPFQTSADASSKVETGVTHFEIFNNLIQDLGAISLVPLLRHSPKLQHFRMCTTRVSHKGGLAIAQALQTRIETLSSLNISDNTFGPEAGAVLANSVFTSDRDLSHLRHLNLSDLGITDDDNEINYMSRIVKQLAQSKHPLNFETIDLSLNELTRSTAQKYLTKLVKRCSHSLKHLNLESNPIRTAGAISLLHALSSCENLVDVNLTDCSLHSSGIVDALQQFVQSLILTAKEAHTAIAIKRIGLNGNTFDEEAIEGIRAAIKPLHSHVNAVATQADDILGTLSENDDADDGEESEEESTQDSEPETESSAQTVKQTANNQAEPDLDDLTSKLSSAHI